MPAAVLWGIGTAIGEVPPYLLARAAAQAGKARRGLTLRLNHCPFWIICDRIVMAGAGT